MFCTRKGSTSKSDGEGVQAKLPSTQKQKKVKLQEKLLRTHKHMLKHGLAVHVAYEAPLRLG